MAANPNDERLLAEQVNRRYWDTDQSVNQIADELGISKGALYALLDLLPAGLSCPRCGQELGYPNRTAREKAFVTCAACGFEEEVGAVAAATGGAFAAETVGPVDPAPDEGQAGVVGAGGPAAAAPRAAAPDTVALVGATLVGLAAGLLLGSWLYGRR